MLSQWNEWFLCFLLAVLYSSIHFYSALFICCKTKNYLFLLYGFFSFLSVCNSSSCCCYFSRIAVYGKYPQSHNMIKLGKSKNVATFCLCDFAISINALMASFNAWIQRISYAIKIVQTVGMHFKTTFFPCVSTNTNLLHCKSISIHGLFTMHGNALYC